MVRRKLTFPAAWESQDAEDVAAEVMVELIGRLRAMKEAPESTQIGAFEAYTAVAAYHACHEYLRRKYPNRHRLKTQIRYLLNNEKRLAIWEQGPAEWWCGFEAWQAERRAAAPPETVNRWREILADIPRGRSKSHPGDLVTDIFDRLGAPVDLDDLVGIVGEIWGVEDPPPAPESAARDLETGEANPAAQMELRQWMKQLWEQIRELPEGQRAALLLNLRCGTAGSAAALLPLAGVATIREVATAAGFEPDEFAAIWNQLPLDDLAIAERLGVSRQKVINLRKSARERLVRRMGGKYRLV